MIFIPTGTDRDSGRRPWAVWTIAVLCVAIHLAGGGVRQASPEEAALLRWRAFASWQGLNTDPARVPERIARDPELAALLTVEDGAAPGTIRSFLQAPNSATLTQTFGVSRASFEWWQPVTSLFLHARGFSLHLLLNLFFLFAFGVLAESRLGHFGFLAVYFGGGALSGLAQAWIGSSIEPMDAVVPAVGASGAVSALMGVVFAMHPRAMVLGYSLIPFGRAAVSIQWLVGFAVLVDILRTIMDWSGNGNSGIATLAHLGGLAAGFAVGLGLLASGLVRRDDYDSLFAFKQWRRRRELRRVTEQVGSVGPSGVIAARVAPTRADSEPPEVQALRTRIAEAHRARDNAALLAHYRTLAARAPSAVLPAAIQLSVANELAQVGDFTLAAHAYRRFLERFRLNPDADDVRLLLAAIELRRLGDRAAARTTLAGFDGRTLDPQRAAVLGSLREELDAGVA